jgi:sugar lactone lactonase YvrE
MSKRLLALSLLGLASFAASTASAASVAAQEAVRELGQPDFQSFTPNRLDARGLAYPWGVAIDRSRSPNGIWVLDTNNNRVLGWRDVAALRNGSRADVVLGQPDAFTNTCNTGGVSASSLCEVESPFSGAYEPGLAVDAEGNLYVVDRFNQRILGYRRPFDTDRVADLVLGQKGFDQTGPPSGGGAEYLYHPHGLAADAQGNLYVADERRVVEFDRPFAADGFADRVFAENRSDPSAPDQVAYADDVALDAQGRLYVADGWMDRVMIWKEPLLRQGAADLILNQGAITCEYPGCNKKGIEVEPDGDLWVGGHDKGRILGYRSPVDTDAEPDRILQASNSAHVFNPLPPDGRPAYAGGGLAVDETGTLWLVDASRVLGFLDPWGGDDRADHILGQVRPDQAAANLVDRDGLQFPSAMALDLSSSPARLYVVDSGNSRVLGWADAESFANGQPADLVLGQPDRWKSGCNTGGRSLTSLCLGQSFSGIAVDSKGTVWVSDPVNQRVVGYRSPFTTDRTADRVLGGISGSGCATGPRGLCIPGGLAVDKAGNLFVADIGNNRILVFDEPMRRDAVADRVLGADGFHRNVCNSKVSLATCFSAPNGSHPGLDVSGGSLAMDAAGRLLVGNIRAVYVFERPLQVPNRSRRLIDLSSVESSYFDPQSLAVDSAGRIYLTVSPHVYGFSRSGAGPILELGETCTFGYSSGLPENLGPASLCNPMGVAVGPGDELFVSDTAVNRVVVFELP